jgi:hypothetical protein
MNYQALESDSALNNTFTNLQSNMGAKQNLKFNSTSHHRNFFCQRIGFIASSALDNLAKQFAKVIRTGSEKQYVISKRDAQSNLC